MICTRLPNNKEMELGAVNALAVMAIVYRGAQLALYDRDHIYAVLGDKNSAFEFLEKVFQEKSPDCLLPQGRTLA